MNRLFTKRFGALMISIILISSISFSQFDNVDFLKSGTTDAVKLMQAYITPWANAFGAGLNGSWYNTAKPHKFGGFDITTGINVGMVPSSADTYDITKLGLSANITGGTMAPSISGPSSGTTPTLTYSTSGVTVATFNAPPGTTWRYMPVPTAQIGIGLPLGTEIKARFIPKIKIQNGDISLWGVGIMHSLMQYMPGHKLIKADVSLFAGYTKLQGNIPVHLNPDPSLPTSATANVPYDNQKIYMSIDALNVGLIASLNLPVITFYGGIGYGKTGTDVKFKGNYPVPGIVSTPTPHAENLLKTGDQFPVIDIKNFAGLRANIGLRIKLAVITIHADYTKAQYDVASAGLGISFR